MEFEFNLKALKILGFLVPTDKQPSCLHRLWNIVTLLQLVILHALIVIDFVTGLSPTIYARVLSSFHLLLGSIIVFRSLYFSMRRARIQQLISMLDNTFDDGQRVPRAEAAMKRKSMQKIRRFSTFMFAYTIVVILTLIGSFMLFRMIATFLRVGNTINKKTKGTPRFILYKTWWPTNIRETPTYYFIILWQGFTATFTLAVLTITDAFTCALLLAASARAEFLTRTISRAIQPRRYNKHQLSRSFRAWLIRHQRYLTMMEELNAVAGPLVFIAHLTTLLMCIVFSYIIYKINDTVMMGMLMGLNLGALIQLAIMSYAGQLVIDTVLSASMSYLLFLLQFKSTGPKILQDN